MGRKHPRHPRHFMLQLFWGDWITIQYILRVGNSLLIHPLPSCVFSLSEKQLSSFDPTATMERWKCFSLKLSEIL